MRLPLILLTLILLGGLGRAAGEQPTDVRWQSGAPSVAADRPFPLRRYVPPPVDNRYVMEGPAPAYCVELAGGLRVCKVLSQPEGFTFVIEQDGLRLYEWQTGRISSPWDFEVLRGDLDADGADEMIVADLGGISNGRGIQNWTISIFAGPEQYGYKLPLQFSIKDYGAAAFVKHPRDRRAHVLVTEWQDLKHPRRDDGSYLIGRWFHYQAGRLMPLKNRPVVVRRYLYGFAHEVGETTGEPHVPLRWFQNPRAETLDREPDIVLPQPFFVEGEIIKVKKPKDSYAYYRLRVIVRLASGETRKFTYTRGGPINRGLPFHRFGSLSTGRIFPEGYRGNDLNAWLLGRRVRIPLREGEFLRHTSGPLNVLWLIDE